MKWRLALFIFCLICFINKAFAETNDASVKVKWSYLGNDGPAHWGELDPSFKLCAEGRQQSPINITDPLQLGNQPLAIHYQAAPLVMVEDGTTNLLLGKTQTIIDDGHTVQLNFPSGAKEEISFHGDNYRLIQLHFHSPSENTLKAEAFPAEIHFVHQGKEGRVAVIGVFVKSGKENASLKKILANLPPERGKIFPVKGESLNPLNLLPQHLDYYDFQGSLTTPPCGEGVEWMVMKEAIEASPAQIVELRRAIGEANARPVQALYDRKIGFNQKGK